MGGFTHRGRPLLGVDDFQDDIEHSEEDDINNIDPEDRDQHLGKLSDEMVMTMNFGGGRRPPVPSMAQPGKPEEKTRKEVFEEIIAKSKAYKAARFEIREAAKELTDRLDSQFFDILPLLNMSKVKIATNEPAPELDGYEQIAAKLKETTKALPSHVIMGD